VRFFVTHHAELWSFLSKHPNCYLNDFTFNEFDISIFELDKNMEALFWTLLSFIFYTYLGYPLVLCIESLFIKHPVSTGHTENPPRVSVVIAARNEEKNIERRIRNIMNQNYPKEKLELLIISDGSADATDDIVKAVITETARSRKGFLKIHSHKPSFGKPFCINTGVVAATGDIVVFADCRQRFADNAIKELVKNFVDQKIGCVSGELVFEETPGSSIQAEMGAYWNFEKWVRKLESKTGSVPGATGAIYAIRKNLFHPLPEQTLLDDVLTPLRISMQGYRSIFDSGAIAYDTVSKNLHLEKKRKVRTLAGNWQLLNLEPILLNPFKNLLWFRFLSHKILRLLIPYCLITLLSLIFFLQDLYAILLLIAFFLFFLIASLPLLTGYFKIISKFTKIFRVIILLNYFALLAPLKLILTPKKLW
jgi:poly-beta-1,6-N-acetyl-D-glucosamine synthase